MRREGVGHSLFMEEYPTNDQIYLCFRSLTMDKGWMKVRNKFSVEYREGVSQFLEIVKFHVDAYERIRCPCKRCMNTNWDSLEGVE